MSKVTEDFTQRYARHLLLHDMSLADQQKLAQSSILILGLGGLGSAVAFYLAASGIGRLGLCDGDMVELSNLQRQILYQESDIGFPKVKIAAQRLHKLRSDIDLLLYESNFTTQFSSGELEKFDLIIDAGDNSRLRYDINALAWRCRKPWLHAAVQEKTMRLALFNPNWKGAGCYECAFGPPSAKVDTAFGVWGPVPGIAGSWQALWALHHVLGRVNAQTMLNKVLHIDPLAGLSYHTSFFSQDGCRVCAI